MSENKISWFNLGNLTSLKKKETFAQLHNKSNRGKRGIKVTGALRSAGFQKIPARPQIVFNRFTCLNMLV